MAEKLYRIKPLVWKGNRAETGAAVEYEIHLRDASISKFAVMRRTWESWGQPKTEELELAFSLEDCKIMAQRDYEARLLHGVVEEVEREEEITRLEAALAEARSHTDFLTRERDLAISKLPSQNWPRPRPDCEWETCDLPKGHPGMHAARRKESEARRG